MIFIVNEYNICRKRNKKKQQQQLYINYKFKSKNETKSKNEINQNKFGLQFLTHSDFFLYYLLVKIIFFFQFRNEIIELFFLFLD
jgi:hypothetical protein